MTNDQPIKQVTPITKDSSRCWKIFDWLCKVYIIIFTRRGGGDPCVYIPEHIINRPDPCIYSQFLLMQLNQPVTWDNPDISIFLNNVEQYAYDLKVDTEYDVVISVHNSSREKPAIGTKIDVRWIEFGAGAQIRHSISTLMADVPVWPGIAQVSTKWRTPASPGHYCIEVELAHPDDGNPSNNRGWNNTQVKAAASEVKVPIRIFNHWIARIPTAPTLRPGRGWMSMVVAWGGLGLLAGVAVALIKPDLFPGFRFLFWPIIGYLTGFFAGYAIQGPPTISRKDKTPEPQPQIPWNLVEITVDSYRFHDKKGKEADPDALFAQRPPAWPARVEPNLFHFAENETYRDVLLIVDAPDEAATPEVFNVNVRQGGYPTGGVTVKVFPKEGV